MEKEQNSEIWLARVEARKRELIRVPNTKDTQVACRCILTTMRFHILAASATVVQTVLQPASSISFCGLLYNRLYITLAPSPGSHCKWEAKTKEIVKTICWTYKLSGLLIFGLWREIKLSILSIRKRKMWRRCDLSIKLLHNYEARRVSASEWAAKAMTKSLWFSSFPFFFVVVALFGQRLCHAYTCSRPPVKVDAKLTQKDNGKKWQRKEGKLARSH